MIEKWQNMMKANRTDINLCLIIQKSKPELTVLHGEIIIYNKLSSGNAYNPLLQILNVDNLASSFKITMLALDRFRISL